MAPGRDGIVAHPEKRLDSVVAGCDTTHMAPEDSAPEELSDVEAAQYRAADSATKDLRAAFECGDPDERTAAGGAFLQALGQLDPASTRDKLHVPDDAGPYRDALIAMMLRIPEQWGRWISCSKGWYPLITRLDEQLAGLDPDYELHQVKEKFGGLRYYAHTQCDGVSDRFDALIRDAEHSSVAICELCGAPGVLNTNNYRWVRTLCPACAAVEGYDRYC